MNLFIAITFLFSLNISAEVSCKNGEIRVKSTWVNSYQRTDGTSVNGYYKNSYCRKSTLKLNEINFGENSTSSYINNSELKKWTKKEINTVLSTFENIPSFYKNITVNSILRLSKRGSILNPASSFPLEKTIILTDSFFKNPNKERIISHELTHILYPDMSDDDKIMFAQKLGWVIENRKLKSPPKALIYPDSIVSPVEDIANNFEAFFYDSNRLQALNPEMYLIIKKYTEKK